MKKLSHPLIPGIVLFLLALLIALLTYQDYGISWDESLQRQMGVVSYNYIRHNDPSLKTFTEKDHGVGFEVPLYTLEKALHLTDSRDIYLMRHLATHIFFLFAAFCCYILAYRLFKNQWLAMLAFIMLVFHPRMYAHSFFNSKDLTFLSAFIIAMLFTQIAFSKNKSPWYLFMGVAWGYATSIRVPGILPAAFLCLFLFADIITAALQKKKLAPPFISTLLFIAGFCGSLYTCWPLLWAAPFSNFTDAYASMSHFRWENKMLFAGQFVKSTSLPFYYIPVWLAITTPLIWVLAGAAGATLVIISAVKSPLRFITNTPQRIYLFFLLCCIMPVITVIALHSVVYDDWRHVYFIYPPFVMLALLAIYKLATGKKKYIAIALCSLQILFIGGFMIKYHPFHEVYFNELVSHDNEALRKNYELDYWGPSFKQGIDYVLDHDKYRTIKLISYNPEIHDNNPHIRNNTMLLPANQRSRVQVVDEIKDADYFITNFRLHPGDYPYPVFYNIKVLNSTILTVYKINH